MYIYTQIYLFMHTRLQRVFKPDDDMTINIYDMNVNIYTHTQTHTKTHTVMNK